MPERQLTNRTHACVYVCVEEDRVNVTRSCLGLTRGMRVCDDSIIRDRERQNAEMARMCVFVCVYAQERVLGTCARWMYGNMRK